jgi:predicted nucleic acid-binding Zn ribbon protein
MHNHLSSAVAYEDLFTFQWPRFTQYELVYPEKKPKRGGSTSAALMNDTGPLIVKRGAEATQFPPRSVDDLHRQFASIGDEPEAVLEFVRRFGFLGLDRRTPPQAIDQESVAQILDARDHMREALTVFDDLTRMETKARRLRKEMLEEGQPVASDFAPGDFRQVAGGFFNQWASPQLVARLVPVTDARHRAGLKLVLAPRTLIGSMWLQIAEELTGGAKFRHCDWCGQPIRIGANGGRSDKSTCSDACRQALSKHNRMQRGSTLPKPKTAKQPKKVSSK